MAGRPGSGAGNTYIGAMLAGSRATTMSIKGEDRTEDRTR